MSSQKLFKAIEGSVAQLNLNPILAIVLAGTLSVSNAVAETPPTPPGQPLSGPGGSAYAHRSVKKCGSLGEGARAFHLYEPSDPAPATAPVIVFLHGYLGVNPVAYGAWIEHLVRRGNIVVFPIYQDSLIGAERYSDDALAAVHEAFRILSSEPDHVRPDAEGRWGLVGHSLGGPIAANLAAEAQSAKLPRPRALLACNSGDANTVFKNIPSILRSPEKIPDLLLLVVVGKEDPFAKETTGRAIFEKSGWREEREQKLDSTAHRSKRAAAAFRGSFLSARAQSVLRFGEIVAR